MSYYLEDILMNIFMNFNVTLMSPIGYVHGLALLGLAEFINNQIIRCGYISTLSKNRIIYDGINIILGAHIQPEDISHNHDEEKNSHKAVERPNPATRSTATEHPRAQDPTTKGR
jgi:hypothetical protein